VVREAQPRAEEADAAEEDAASSAPEGSPGWWRQPVSISAGVAPVLASLWGGTFLQAGLGVIRFRFETSSAGIWKGGANGERRGGVGKEIYYERLN